MIIYYSGYGGLKDHPEYDPEFAVEKANVMLTYNKRDQMRKIALRRIKRILKYRNKK